MSPSSFGPPSLSYASAGMARAQGKPGVLIAVGVLSIIFGLASAAANLVGFGLSLQFFSAMPATSPTAAAPMEPVAPYAGDMAAPAGLAREDRLTVLGALKDLKNFSLDRQEMLRRLMGECGKRVFADQSLPLLPSSVRRAISERGQLPAGPDGLRTLGSHFFRTATGTVIIDDGMARFIETGASSTTVRGDYVSQNGLRRRSIVQVVEKLDELHAKLGPSFNALQATVLAKEMMNAAPRRPDGEEAVDPQDVHMAGAAVEFRHPYPTWIAANGRWVQTNGQTLDPQTGLAVPRRRSNGPKISATAAMFMMADAGISVALGVWLLIMGIMLLAGADRAVALHVQYAWAKLLLIVLTAVCGGLIVMSERQAFTLAHALGFSISVIIALGFPLCLLIVMRSSAVKQYCLERGICGDAVSAQTRVWMGSVMDRLAARRGMVGGIMLAALLALGGNAWLGMSGEKNGWSGGVHAAGAVVCLVAAGACLALQMRQVSGEAQE